MDVNTVRPLLMPFRSGDNDVFVASHIPGWGASEELMYITWRKEYIMGDMFKFSKVFSFALFLLHFRALSLSMCVAFSLALCL